MYLDFFSLEEKPFNITPDTRFWYLSTQHEEAVATMLYGVQERRGFVLLTGEVGTGKTTSIRALLNRLQQEDPTGRKEMVETALIVNPLLSVVELIKAINKDFGCDRPELDSVQGQLEVLNQFLLDNDRRGGNAVVIIDEGQNLSLESLEMLRLLSNLETESHKLIQLILVGQPELEKKLEKPELRQLRQRIQLRYVLQPFSVQETSDYITHRIRRVSPKSCIAFRPSAVKKIYEYCSGVPRMINSLCDFTLMAAYTHETHVVTKQIVDLAYEEMSIGSGQAPRRFWYLRRRRG